MRFLVAAVSLTVEHFSSKLFFMFPVKVIERFYYAHWLLLALGCSAVIDLLVEKKTSVFLLLTIVAIMVLACFALFQGIIFVALALVGRLLLSPSFVGNSAA